MHTLSMPHGYCRAQPFNDVKVNGSTKKDFELKPFGMGNNMCSTVMYQLELQQSVHR